MDERRLLAFVVVAEELNFTRAAGRLHMTQSSVSSTIRGLEVEVGAPLLARTTRSVVLTEAGRRFLPEARVALEALDRARSAVGGADALSGSLSIGTLSGFETVDIPSLAGAFHRLHPNVDLRIEISSRGTAGHLERVRSGLLDLAFVGQSDAMPDLILWPVRDFDLSLLVPAGHALADSRSASLAELSREAFVDQPSGFWQRGAVDAAFAAAGFERRIVAEAMDLRTLPAYIENGLGIGFVPDALALASISENEGLALRAVDTRISWTVAIAARRQHAPTRAAHAFLELVPEFTDASRPF